MDIIRKIRLGRLTQDTLTDPNVPNYIKAGFKTNLDFLRWLNKDKQLKETKEYLKWGYKSPGKVMLDYMMETDRAMGLPPTEVIESSGSFVVPSGKYIED